MVVFFSQVSCNVKNISNSFRADADVSKLFCRGNIFGYTTDEFRKDIANRRIYSNYAIHKQRIYRHTKRHSPFKRSCRQSKIFRSCRRKRKYNHNPAPHDNN